MYVTDVNGKVVQFTYYNDDSDDELSSSVKPIKPQKFITAVPVHTYSQILKKESPLQ